MARAILLVLIIMLVGCSPIGDYIGDEVLFPTESSHPTETSTPLTPDGRVSCDLSQASADDSLQIGGNDNSEFWVTDSNGVRTSFPYAEGVSTPRDGFLFIFNSNGNCIPLNDSNDLLHSILVQYLIDGNIKVIIFTVKIQEG